MSTAYGHDTEGIKAQAGRFHSKHNPCEEEFYPSGLSCGFGQNEYPPDENNKHC